MIRTSPRSQGSSPHSRGALFCPMVGWETAGIIPAFAGSTSPASACPGAEWDHPRIRGEHGAFNGLGKAAEGSSPHSRGAHRPGDRRERPPGIIPAFAGSTGRTSTRTAAPRDHPRIRGEHYLQEAPVFTDVGSSPHSRGAPNLLVRKGALMRIIPAFAGSTLDGQHHRHVLPDHPRIRGEHCNYTALPGTLLGSSPHSRGALVHGQADDGARRIIPAFAGSTSAQFTGLWHRRGSSPHSRGAPAHLRVGRRGRGIIPAFAGSTMSATSRVVNTGDHPRIRGEHAAPVCSTYSFSGSSPHSRGALNLDAPVPSLTGIIPAFAGSTALRSR